MSTVLWVLLAVLVVGAVVAGFLWSPAVRRQRLQERFGPAYERALADEGDRRSAEQRLVAVAKRRKSLDIRPLSERDRQSFLARWKELQSDFVDQPVTATGRADDLITEVVHARGYPVEDFSTRAYLLAVDHPQAAENYRQAATLRKRNHGLDATADTEELRAALVQYRGVFELLIGLDATRNAGYADLDVDLDAGRAGTQEKAGARPAVTQGSARDHAGREPSG